MGSDLTAGASNSSAPHFSIVIICRDEARTLPRLFFDLDEFLDRDGEVLVVDTGSTDDSPVIAKTRGCKVEFAGDRFDTILNAAHVLQIEKRFAKGGEQLRAEAGQRLFNFAAARQYAGERAANQFILQLDASDQVKALDVDVFNELIDGGGVGSFEYEQEYGNAQLRIARFYDRSRYHWEGRVHEVLMVTPSPDGKPGDRLRLDPMELKVYHRADMGKSRNYLAGLALQVLESPEKPRWWHFLGRELFYDRCFQSAIGALEVHTQFKNVWSAELSQSYSFVGECYEALGRTDEAKQNYERAFSIDPSRREALLRHATICSRLCDFENAARLARQALDIPHTNAYPEPESNYTWLPHSLLYWNLFWLGRRDEARVHWDAYRSQAPGSMIMKEHARLFPVASKGQATEASAGIGRMTAPTGAEPTRPLKPPDPPVSQS